MKTLPHIVRTALLLLMTIPICARDKNPERAEDTLKMVRVVGQVTRPGSFEYRDDTTILAMIIAAGGPTEFGTLKRVKVFRGGKLLQFDLTKENLKNEVAVKPDDVIEVPQKNIFGR